MYICVHIEIVSHKEGVVNLEFCVAFSAQLLLIPNGELDLHSVYSCSNLFRLVLGIHLYRD